MRLALPRGTSHGWTPAAAVAAAIVCAGAACGGPPEATPESGTAVAVTVQPARTETLRDALAYPGAVVPAASGDFTATASEPAEIVELPKAQGDAVAAGDLLVRFDIPAITNEIATREIEVNAARMKAEAARAEATRMEGLHERGIASRNAMEASRSAAIETESMLTQVQALLDAARAQQQRTEVRARFDGIVSQVWQAPGAYIATPGEPILRVIDPNRVQVLMQLPLADFQRTAPGQSATVQPPGGPALPATVVLRSPPASASTLIADVRLDFAAPPALPIDTPVQVDLLIEERQNVLTVPVAAVQRDAGAPYVWVAGDDGLAHRREVRVGLTSAGRAQILSGLVPGERVILTGISELNEGTVIRVS